MINHISQNENTKNDFSKTIKELHIGKLLRRSNISKNCGISIPFVTCISGKKSISFPEFQT